MGPERLGVKRRRIRPCKMKHGDHGHAQSMKTNGSPQAKSTGTENRNVMIPARNHRRLQPLTLSVSSHRRNPQTPLESHQKGNSTCDHRPRNHTAKEGGQTVVESRYRRGDDRVEDLDRDSCPRQGHRQRSHGQARLCGVRERLDSVLTPWSTSCSGWAPWTTGFCPERCMSIWSLVGCAVSRLLQRERRDEAIDICGSLDPLVPIGMVTLCRLSRWLSSSTAVNPSCYSRV